MRENKQRRLAYTRNHSRPLEIGVADYGTMNRSLILFQIIGGSMLRELVRIITVEHGGDSTNSGLDNSRNESVRKDRRPLAHPTRTCIAWRTAPFSREFLLSVK
ncbi:hypothetical protein Trydic_g15590 [Trypoxylus dichotomus]